ncbi:MAG: DUF1294 domain-containing protein [Thaumarchaeota archaeon]|nr:DUF1294 domain-containing protein [Nitrososphaerota archaeon]
MEILGAWFLITGVIGFLVMLIDKSKSIHGERRIRERNLLILSAIGGFWGVIIASEIGHHKTEKLEFMLPVFGTAIIWLAALSNLGIFARCVGV